MDINTTELEKSSLEAHVDLCAMRYKHLESRLAIIEHKVESLTKAIEDSKNSMSKVIIGASATIVASILSLVVALVMKF